MSIDLSNFTEAQRHDVQSLPDAFVLHGAYTPYPEDLTDDELKWSIDALAEENRLMFLENDMCEKYLQRNDPNMLLGLQKMLDTMLARQIRMMALANTKKQSVAIGAGSTSSIPYRERSPTTMVSRKSGAMSFGALSCKSENAPALRFTHKMGMVMREVEELRTLNTNFREQVGKAKAANKVKLQQLAAELGEYENAKADFSVKVIPSKEPGPKAALDKYIIYFDRIFRDYDYKICKLRLQQTVKKKSYDLKKIQLAEKRELGESLRPVDIQILKNEQVALNQKYDDVTQEFMQLKVWGTLVASELTEMKKRLTAQQKECSEIDELMKSKQDTIDKCNVAIDRITAEVQTETVKLEKIRDMRSTYVVPDILEYLKVKDELFRLQKEIKSWTRRKAIQHRNLKACTFQLQTMQGLDDVEYIA